MELPSLRQVIANKFADGKANATLAKGVPPLTQEMADSYLEVLLAVNEFRMVQQIQAPSTSERAWFTAQLASRYGNFSRPVQAWFGSLPLGWAQLRDQLASAIADEREQLLAGLDAKVTGLRLIGPPPPGSHGGKPFSVPTNPSGQDYGIPYSWIDRPTTKSDPLMDIYNRDLAEAEEWRKTDPELAAQMEDAAYNRHVTRLSNQMQARNTMLNKIVDNFRA